MGKTKLILAVSYLVVLTAGGACGWMASQDKRPQRSHSWLARELDLTPQQQEQMRQIWSRHVEEPNSRGERRRALVAERDTAIVGLLNEEQKTKYDQIQKDYETKVAELAQERKAAWDDSVQKTRAILTPEQVKKYEELIKRQQERRDRDRSGRGGRGHERGDRNLEANSSRVGTEK